MNAGSKLRIPGATYRLQLNRGFTFAQAADIVEYLWDLGITDVYFSPLFTAPPESNHGYDVCDYNEFNPVLGGAEGWKTLADKLRRQGMGSLLDFVPNHMGTVPQLNKWWRDVLEFGPESAYAKFFDIDWNSPNPLLKNRVLLPILEDTFEKVVAQGLFMLAFTPLGIQIDYRGMPLPVNPRSYREILNRAFGIEEKKPTALQEVFELLPNAAELLDHARFEQAKKILAVGECSQVISQALQRINEHIKEPEIVSWLESLLRKQSYWLEYWKTGTKKANYRRFFDVDGLIGVNMDLPEVFAASHQLLKQCANSGEVTGIRLDHIDGLADPTAYLKNLQNFLKDESDQPTEGDRNFYILVEKILMGNERVRPDWPVFGTTGYEFAAAATQVLVDSAQCTDLTDIYNSFVPELISLKEIISRSKRQVMGLGLNREIGWLVRLLKECVNEAAEIRNLSDEQLADAIRELMVHLSVYRTYIAPGGKIASADKDVIYQAAKLARNSNAAAESKAIDLLVNVLLAENLPTGPGDVFLRRFQQFSGPIMAKSFEDTTFFIYNRLIALNEVGGNPGEFGCTPAAFHELNLRRLDEEPHAMLTTSTHDTKLSEDARARVVAISEIPEQWREFLQAAKAKNVEFKTSCAGKLAPDSNEEYLFYQILLASWPLAPMAADAKKNYAERVQRHMLKAIREAKVHTRWDHSNEAWENALHNFVEKIIHQPPPEFKVAFELLAKSISELGVINSMSQTLLKLTAPGVPDIYQGNELWQFFLTDPDNREQIDFVKRREILETLKTATPARLMDDWRNGAIKMFLTRTILRFRRTHPDLFKKGDYRPLTFTGKFQNNCLGFIRVLDEKCAITIVPRLTAAIGFPPLGSRWDSTELCLPGVGGGQWTNLFTGKIVTGSRIQLATVFKEFPAALLSNCP